MRTGLRKGLPALTLAALTSVCGAAMAQVAPHANQYGLNLIGAPAAWALGYTGTGITVAVADTGIDLGHPAFTGKHDPRGRNYVLPSPGGAFDATQIAEADTGGHGTHVSGIIGASGTSGAPGVAYNANILTLRATSGCAAGQNCDAPNFPNASASALDYFAGLSNVMVYNASYGPNSGKNQTIWSASLIDPVEAEAAQRALAAGKIIVAANGNDRAENPVAGLHPNGMALLPFISPANAGLGVYQDGNNTYNFSALLRQPGLIIAANSVGEAKTIAPYSQACGAAASWCLTAPGGDQSVDAGIYATLPGSTYGYQQGTSMAAPMISGAIAVLQQAYPGYAARDLAHVLFSTAENIGGRLANNATYGYGLIRLDRAVAGPTTLAAGTTITVGNQQMTYWSQPLTTAGGFTKTGAGALMIAGRTTAAGDAAVNDGALGVGGTLTLQGTSRLTVAQGATLAGIGTINGAVTVAGTLNAGQLPNYADVIANSGGTLPAGTPLTGTSPGTLTVQGQVTMAASGTLRANIDGAAQVPGGPGTYDKIVVTGTGGGFAANGALVPVLRDIPGGTNGYTPPVGSVFPIILAQNGASVSGQFTSVNQTPAGIGANTRFDVVYSPTSVTLNVTPLNFAAVAAEQNLNRNQQAVAAALDTVRPAPGIRARARVATALDELYDENLDEDDDIFALLSGQGLASHPAAMLDGLGAIGGTISARQAQRLAAEDWSLWAQGFGRWSRTGDDGGLPGATATASGFVLGADRMFADNVTAGVALGYGRAATEGFGAIAQTNLYSATLYGSWTPGPWVLDARVSTGPLATTTDHVAGLIDLDLVQGAADGWSVSGDLRAGYGLALAGVSLTPWAGISVQSVMQDGYFETTDIGLLFPAQDFTRVRAGLGVDVQAQFALDGFTIAPRLGLAWQHDLADALRVQTSLYDAPFAIEAAHPGRDSLRTDLEVALNWGGRFSLFAGYGGAFHRNQTAHQVRGGIRIGL